MYFLIMIATLKKIILNNNYCFKVQNTIVLRQMAPTYRHKAGMIKLLFGTDIVLVLKYLTALKHIQMTFY